MRILKPGSDGSTYGGYPLAGRVGTAVLNYIQRNDICSRATKIGDYFTQKLTGIPGIKTDHRGALIRVELEGVKTAKYACLEMLLGKNRNPRVFMKHGHYDPIRDVAYTRIAPPIGAMTEKLIFKFYTNFLEIQIFFKGEIIEQGVNKFINNSFSIIE